MADVFAGLYDIKMTLDGDLVIDAGDIGLVNGIDWFVQEVNKIVRTNNPEWELHPNVGASLEDFAGQPNVREVGRAIEERLHAKITEDNIQFPGTLSIKVVPVSISDIKVYINLEIEDRTVPVSHVVFDYNNGVLRTVESTVPPPTIGTTAGGTTTPAKNPYLSRIK